MSYYCGEHKDRPTPTAAVKEEASKGTAKDEAGAKKPTANRKPRSKSKPTTTTSKD
jgi:hypothetical protein